MIVLFFYFLLYSALRLRSRRNGYRVSRTISRMLIPMHEHSVTRAYLYRTGCLREVIILLCILLFTDCVSDLARRLKQMKKGWNEIKRIILSNMEHCNRRGWFLPVRLSVSQAGWLFSSSGPVKMRKVNRPHKHWQKERRMNIKKLYH